MGSGTDMNDPTYIKDGIARLVVEMVKREWPQQWPNFLQELTDLAQVGKEYQIEVDQLLPFIFHQKGISNSCCV